MIIIIRKADWEMRSKQKKRVQLVNFYVQSKGGKKSNLDHLVNSVVKPIINAYYYKTIVIVKKGGTVGNFSHYVDSVVLLF